MTKKITNLNLFKPKKQITGKLIKGTMPLAVIGMLCLTGCMEEELSNNSISSNSIDTITNNTDNNTNDTDISDSKLESVDIISNTIIQELEVPGEDFKLVVEYSCLLEDNSEWTVTGNKELFTKIYTKGLPENKKVWINDIHTDTTILSVKAEFNDIIQDTLDDGIHNAPLKGYDISDDTFYYGINVIQGQNEQFIEGYFRAHNGTGSGSVEQKRYLESDYLENGVYANKITSVYGLLIGEEKDNRIDDNNIRGVDVPSKIKVDFYNRVLFVKNGQKYYKVYTIDKKTGSVIVQEEKIGYSKTLTQN